MKIVVPVMPRSLDEANQLDISKYEHADIIEWRADYLPKEMILTVAPAIFEKISRGGGDVHSAYGQGRWAY